MEKMGWSKGKGLGANLDGRMEPVKASLRTDNRGRFGQSRVGYRLQKQYHGTLLHTAVRTTVYRNSIKLTVIMNLSAAMGIHLTDLPTSHGV